MPLVLGLRLSQTGFSFCDKKTWCDGTSIFSSVRTCLDAGNSEEGTTRRDRARFGFVAWWVSTKRARDRVWLVRGANR